MITSITAESNLTSATIYISHLEEWASITGACLKDGEFHLIWKTPSNQFGLMELSDALLLVKTFACPF